MNQTDPEIKFKEQVQADKLKLLYYQSFPAVLVSVLTAILLGGILWNHLEQTFLLLWLGAVIGSSMLRLVLFIFYFKQRPEGSSVLAWEKPYFITLVVSSLVWGAGSVLMMPQILRLYQAIIYFFLLGMAGGALSVYSARMKFAMSAILILILPATFYFMTRGETTPFLVGIGGLIFLISAIRATRISEETLNRNYLMKHALQDARDNAEKLASTDYLTELNNRRAFYEKAEKQFNYCKRYVHPVSAILLDVDHFKNINDTYGHASGDLALQHLAKILSRNIRDSDFCGRIGGEEFAVFLPNTDPVGACIVAEKVRDAIARNPVVTPEGEFYITVSIGVVSEGKDLDHLLKLADTAMYKAKDRGKNQVYQYGT